MSAGHRNNEVDSKGVLCVAKVRPLNSRASMMIIMNGVLVMNHNSRWKIVNCRNEVSRPDCGAAGKFLAAITVAKC